MAADPKAILRRWEELRALRLLREGEWQQIADVFMPRKDFTCSPVPGQLRSRRVTTSVPQVALSRFAGLLVAYLIDPTRPFIKPNVDRGLIQAGRRLDLKAEGIDYVDTLQWAMFDRMMLPQSGFWSGVSRVALELGGFGSAVLWTGRKRGFGPRYQARPIRACWFAVNDEGEVDTLYFKWTMPAWRVIQRYPEAAKVEKIRKLAEDEKTQQTPVELLHAVEPRIAGRAGAVATSKPFASIVVAIEHKAVLEESGFESFPYSVPRLNVEDGSDYGTGIGWQALPDAMVLNSLQGSTERGVSLRNDPPLFAPAQLFGEPVDRRPGAVNIYDEAGLGFQNIKDAVQRLDIAGDVNVGVEYMRMLQQNIEQAFFTDWMRLRETGQMTAEEVRERRDMRLRAMSSFVPAVDRDLMGVAADRTLEAMVEELQLPDPPATLRGVEVDWDYAGPLAVMQQQGAAEAIGRVFEHAQLAATLDPASVSVLAVAEGLRAIAEGFGVPAGVLNSREDVAKERARQAQQQEDQQAAEQAALGAQALRDAGQGAASLAAAGGGPQKQAA